MRKKRSFCFVKKWLMSLLCTFSHFFLVIESVAKPGGAHISQLVISIDTIVQSTLVHGVYNPGA